MIQATVRRLAEAAVVSVVVVLIAFVLIHLVPGDPARTVLGTRASPERIEALRADLGLDRPLPEQIASYLAGIPRGDLGTSLIQRDRPVADILMPAFGVTMTIIALTVLLSVVVATCTGLWAALARRRAVDRTTNALTTLLLAMPPFFVGLVLLWIVSVRLGAAPAGGWAGSWPQNLEYAWLPSVALSAYFAPLVHRTVRTAALEVGDQDFVEAAHARGLGPLRVALRHVLPNSLLPVITLVGLNLGTLVGGAVVVETVFDLPGIGSELVQAVSQRNYPVIQGAALIAALAVVAGNLLADALYAIADPRTRVSH